MLKENKLLIVVIGGTLILAAAVGALFIGETTGASAAVESWLPSSQVVSTINTEIMAEPEAFGHRGGRGMPGPGMPGKAPDGNAFLAEALGVSEEQLKEAHEQASQEALDQSLADGLITQEQYDVMVLRGFAFKGFRGGEIDFDVFLADALGIDEDTLMAAQEQAHQAAIDQALADGILTEEQVEMMQAREALKDYVDPGVLMEQAFGLTVDELKAAREDGKSLSDILSEQGLTALEVREAYQAAHDAAIQQALDDGAITAEQAEKFQTGAHFLGGFKGHGGFGGGRGGGGFHGGCGINSPGKAPRTGTNSDL